MKDKILREIYDNNLKEKIRLKRLENGKIVFTMNREIMKVIYVHEDAGV